MFKRFTLVGLLSTSLLFACGSKPAAGGKCTAGSLACLDGKTGLFCSNDGIWEPMSCRGGGGCKTTNDKVTCNQSVAAVCDVCPGSVVACDVDMNSVLSCTDGKFVPKETCAAGTCKVKGSNVACDVQTATGGGGKTATPVVANPPNAPVSPTKPAAASDLLDVSCPQGTKWAYNASSAFGDGRKNDGWGCVTCDHDEKCPGCKGAACVGGGGGGGGTVPKKTVKPAAKADNHGCPSGTLWSAQSNGCVTQ